MKKGLRGVCAVVAVGLAAFFSPGCALTPARALEGTWETAFAVTFYIRTDFNTYPDMQEVGSEDRMVTWIITATGENEVEIEQTYTYSNRTLIPNSGYTPDVSPNWYTGVISSSSLTVIEKGGLFMDDRIVGEFDFTTDNIAGTWDDFWELAYAQEVYTDTKDLILVR